MEHEQYSSYSDNDEDHTQKKKGNRRKRSCSQEPEKVQHGHHKKQKQRRHSISPIPLKYIVKKEPLSDSGSDRERAIVKQRIKRAPSSDSNSDLERRHIKHKAKDGRGHVHSRVHGSKHRHHSHRDTAHDERIQHQQHAYGEETMSHQQAERRKNDDRRRENRRTRENLLQGFPSATTEDQTKTQPQTQSKDKPNFELSGKLTEDTNTYKGVVIKYNEPPEARKPKKRWRLYPFKYDEAMKPFHMHRQSAYLFGRDRIVVDIPVDHPSCSKQHAVFQYRLVPYVKEDGRKAHKIAPYIIDLDSANGTFINNKKIEPRRYVELMEKDVIKFGFSSREYVLLHDKSNTAEIESDASL